MIHKVLLIAINSKYIHSSLALWYLKENCSKKEIVDILEFTINEDLSKILAKIYSHKPQLIAFSCYIWNIEFVKKLALDLKKLLPTVKIIAGGPEVAFSLEKDDIFDHIIEGEGERAFSQIIDYYCEPPKKLEGFISTSLIQNSDFNLSSSIQDNDLIPTSRLEDNDFNSSSSIEDFDFISAPLIEDLDSILTPYTDEMLQSVGNRILYFESSRGCPFSCSYCISSIGDGVRYFSLARVFGELKRIAFSGKKLIKFVDRTFNCNKLRAYEILNYIISNQDTYFKDTLFHFEVAADLFDQETIELLASARAGLIQFEIGVQTTNAKTLSLIQRKTNIKIIKQNVKRIKEIGKIHLHLDLIAGLPGEDMKSLKKSFNDVYSFEPDMLQLGFLKLLRGTKMRKEANIYGILHREQPPYEVLSTAELTFDEVIVLKGFEEILEKYYNSGRFTFSLKYLLRFFETPFDYYYSLYMFSKKEEFFERSRSSRECYNLMYKQALAEINEVDHKYLNDLLRFDYLLTDNTHNLPEIITKDFEKGFRNKVLCFLNNSQNIEKYCPYIVGDEVKRLFNNINIERFSYDVTKPYTKEAQTHREFYILFDYNIRAKVSRAYHHILIDRNDF